MAAVPNIRWQITQPGLGNNPAETHCAFCLDAEAPGPILAHPLSAQNSTLVHRAHRACIEQWETHECTQCHAPYNPNELPLNEVPRTWTKLIASSLSEIHLQGIPLNLSLYTVLGLLCFPISISISVFNKGWYPPTLKSMASGNITGVIRSAAVLSCVGDPFLFVGRRVVEKTTRPDSLLRKLYLTALPAIVYVASALTLKGLRWRATPPFPPEAQDLLKHFLRDHTTGLAQFPDHLRPTVLQICENTTAIAAGRAAVFKAVLLWKAFMFLGREPLDGFHLWHQG